MPVDEPGTYGTFPTDKLELSTSIPGTSNSEPEGYVNSIMAAGEPSHSYHIPISQDQLESLAPKKDPLRLTLGEQASSACQCTCSKDCVLSFFVRLFPMLHWLRHYKWKRYLIHDVVAGCTVGIMLIPQGMAYAMLASVPPVYGLYTSFFPVIIYATMATSRHLSFGTFAIGSILTSGIIDNIKELLKEQQDSLPKNVTNDIEDTSLSYEGQSLLYTDIQLATVVAFTSGVIQFFMGLLQLGKLAVLMSPELISGFVVAAAVQVITSQIKSLTGIHLQRHTGMFSNIMTWIDIMKSLHTANYMVVIYSASSILILLLCKNVINARYRLKVPIPAELIVVVLGTVSSFFLNMHDRYHMQIVGVIPKGLEPPSVPPIHFFVKILPSSLVLSIVCACSALSMLIIFAKKHEYSVDPNQELLAFGAANIFSSFFSCIPSTVSLSRSSVQEDSGGKSQLASIVSCLIILVVLLALGPVFQKLPICVLSSIIVVALMSIFKQASAVKKAWSRSKVDAAIWFVTFIVGVIIELDMGLIAGIIFSLLTILYRTQFPKTRSLARVPNTEVYRDEEVYSELEGDPEVCICQFGASIFFANKDYFLREVNRVTNLNPRSLMSSQRVEKNCKKEVTNDKQLLLHHNGVKATAGIRPTCSLLRCLILACGLVGNVDSGGTDMLLTVINEYRQIGIMVLLAEVSDSLMERLLAQQFFKDFPKSHVFATVHDAVLYAQSGVAVVSS